jgi:hypothetical protein
MKRLALFLLFAQAAAAQIYFSVAKSTTLSSSYEVVTIQPPGTSTTPSPRLVAFKSVYVDSAVALTFTLERNSTLGPTSTGPLTLTPAGLTVSNFNPSEPDATSTAWSQSNAQGGVLLATYQILAGGCQCLTIDLSSINFQPYLKGQSLTLRTASASGLININFILSER